MNSSQLFSPSNCHICHSKTLHPNTFFAQCCKTICSKSYCIECIKKYFDATFIVQKYKKDTWICYSCQHICKCKKCSKTITSSTIIDLQSEEQDNIRTKKSNNPSSNNPNLNAKNSSKIIATNKPSINSTNGYIFENDKVKKQSKADQKDDNYEPSSYLTKITKQTPVNQLESNNKQKKSVNFNLPTTNISVQEKQKAKKKKFTIMINDKESQSSEDIMPKSYQAIKEKMDSYAVKNPRNSKSFSVTNNTNFSTNIPTTPTFKISEAPSQPISNTSLFSNYKDDLSQLSQLQQSYSQISNTPAQRQQKKSKPIIKNKKQRSLVLINLGATGNDSGFGLNNNSNRLPPYLQSIMKRKEVFRKFMVKHCKKTYQELLEEENQRIRNKMIERQQHKVNNQNLSMNLVQIKKTFKQSSQKFCNQFKQSRHFTQSTASNNYLLNLNLNNSPQIYNTPHFLPSNDSDINVNMLKNQIWQKMQQPIISQQPKSSVSFGKIEQQQSSQYKQKQKSSLLPSVQQVQVKQKSQLKLSQLLNNQLNQMMQEDDLEIELL